MKKPSWDKDGLTFLGRLLSLSTLKKRWLIEETKVKGEVLLQGLQSFLV